MLEIFFSITLEYYRAPYAPPHLDFFLAKVFARRRFKSRLRLLSQAESIIVIKTTSPLQSLNPIDVTHGDCRQLTKTGYMRTLCHEDT